jgi:heme/copper-type cytochrome/quinol oxidase subunit 1
MITPFSSRTRFTAIGKTDIGLMGVFLVINSSIISGANFLVTYRYLSTLNNRKMRDARVFFYRKCNSCLLNDGFCKSNVSYRYFNAFIR